MSIGASPTMSNFPMGFADGVTLRNFPITPIFGGRVFFVSNNTVIPQGCAAGSDNNRGTWQRPFATIAGALAQCLANRGDIVFVKAGHAETFTASAAWNIAGVQIIGLGVGAARPSLTVTGNAVTIAVSAGQMALRNFLVDLTGSAAVAVGFTISAGDFQFTDCQVKTASATGQSTLPISCTTIAASTGLVINGCKFFGTNNAGTTAAVTFVGGDNVQITNSFFQGAYSSGVGAIQNLTTAATNCLIAGNYLNNLTAASTKTITLQAATTGFLSDNKHQILSGTAPVTGAAMSWVGANYFAATIATAATQGTTV